MSQAEIIADAVAAALSDHPGSEPVYVGYSGGLDSTVLLVATREQAHQTGHRVIALHFDHQLHPDSKRWQEHCVHQSKQLEVEIICQRASDVSTGNREQWARTNRYQFFSDQLTAGGLLLLAHHQDDQAETLLLRLFQGRSFVGMPMTRRLTQGFPGILCRPLLGVSKAALCAYAEARELNWLEDPSNDDISLDRNYLRHEILPRLAERWQNLIQRLNNRGQQLVSQQNLLIHLLGSHISSERLEIAWLQQFNPLEQTSIVRLWLETRGEFKVSGAQLLEFVRQLGVPLDRQPELVLTSFIMRRHKNQIRLAPVNICLQNSYPLPMPGELQLPHGTLVVSPLPGSAAEPREAVTVQFGRLQEKLPLAGRDVSKSVSRLFSEAEIPHWQRATYPLVFRGNLLVSVPGLAVREMSDHFAWKVQWYPEPGN